MTAQSQIIETMTDMIFMQISDDLKSDLADHSVGVPIHAFGSSFMVKKCFGSHRSHRQLTIASPSQKYLNMLNITMFDKENI